MLIGPDLRSCKDKYFYLALLMCGAYERGYEGMEINVHDSKLSALATKLHADESSCGSRCNHREHYVIKVSRKVLAKMNRMGWYRRRSYCSWLVENRPHEEEVER